MIKSISKFLSFLFLAPFFRIRICGRENIPEEGALILCSNHISMLDMFFIGYSIKRWIYWMAKEELFRIPVVSFVLDKLWGAFPVRRGKADVESIKTALDHLKYGHIVGIFPQGTRSGKSIRRGAAHIALRADVPLMPVCIKGGKKLFEKVTVKFGRPFRLTEKNMIRNNKDEIKKMSMIIMENINRLMGEVD